MRFQSPVLGAAVDVCLPGWRRRRSRARRRLPCPPAATCRRRWMRRSRATSSRWSRARPTSATSCCGTKARSATTSPCVRPRPTRRCRRPGMRMTPAYAALLPKIKSSNSMSALQTATAANHWKLLFLEFQANSGGYGDIISLGANDSTQTHAVAGALRVHHRPRLRPRRPGDGPEARHRAQQQRHHRHQLLRVGVQGHRAGLAGDRRLQRLPASG